MRDRRADAGSALVTAVIGIAVFALLALEMLDVGRTSLTLIQARHDRASLLAAADAGVAIAIHGLAVSDPAKRLQADGIAHTAYFDGIQLAITVEDDQGKVAINYVGPDVERRLFSAAGIDGARLDILVDSLEDWKDYDDMVRKNGAEKNYYAELGIRPRNDKIRTIEELARLRGMDGALLTKIAPAITLFANRLGNFDAAISSSPLALEAMSGDSAAYDVQKRISLQAGQRPAIDIAHMKSVVERFYTVTVEARLSDEVRASRSIVVQFTGNSANPYWIRYVR